MAPECSEDARGLLLGAALNSVERVHSAETSVQTSAKSFPVNPKSAEIQDECAQLGPDTQPASDSQDEPFKMIYLYM